MIDPGRLVLASASPRRQEILRRAGIDFEIAVSDAEDSVAARGAPRAVALAGARLKARDVALRVSGRLVVGADTVVAVGRHVLGKPADAAEARQMLELLSGRRHEVHTAFAVVRGGDAAVLAEECETSAVTFHVLDAATIAAYVASGDPLDKAGAYGIQSGGAALVAEVIGSYLNVVGLPLARLLQTLAEVDRLARWT
ncbi:MAG: septum formation protein Maf [Armatimonadetes bacterium]|nr:septum formation protein Maf [Armatimonadota bacterium]